MAARAKINDAPAPPAALTALAARFGFAPHPLPDPVISALLVLAAENEALRRELAVAQSAADWDVLTPTLNRRAFMRELQRTIAFVERYGGGAAVLFLDLDGFKAVNDQFGHAAGDAVLVAVAKVLRDQVRETDIVARLGGDEFGIILVQTHAEDARAKALALSRRIAETPIEHEGVAHVVGASIGVHEIIAPEDAEDALARADEAMYVAKALRRRDCAGTR
jgi:diguanylate cyclase (GGDEF)-like protein